MVDIRTRKRDLIRAEIVDAAWTLARRTGIAGLSLRELADAVGMRAPSLYTYFPSKNDLYDAMFAQGMKEYAVEFAKIAPSSDPVETFKDRARAHSRISLENPVRYELLFQRPIPDFVPSRASLQIGLDALAVTRQMAADAGLADDEAFDLFMATSRGLTATQIANDPDGDRWIRLVDDAIDILIAHYGTQQRPTRKGSGKRKR